MEEAVTTLIDLPVETLAIILANSGGCFQLPLVCRAFNAAWRHMCLSPQLWADFIFFTLAHTIAALEDPNDTPVSKSAADAILIVTSCTYSPLIPDHGAFTTAAVRKLYDIMITVDGIVK